MASKSALGKLQETVVGTVRGVAKDPIGTAKGTIALGRAVAGQVAGQVTRTVKDRVGGTPSAPSRPQAVPAADETPVPKPTDVARVVEKKPAAKKAAKKAPPRKKAAAAKTSPSGKLPAKKAAAKKAPAKEAAAKKTAAKKTTPPPQTAAEVLEDAGLESPVEAVTEQPAATEPLIDPATTKAVAAEAETGARAADPSPEAPDNADEKA